MKILRTPPRRHWTNIELETEAHVREHASELRDLAHFALTADRPAIQIGLTAFYAAHALHRLANAIRETRRQALLKQTPDPATLDAIHDAR